MTKPRRAGTAPASFERLSSLVAVEDEGWTRTGLGDLEALVAACVSVAARRLGLPETLETELSVTFTGDAEVKAINAEWRGKDAATNVLSFPMADLDPGELPGPMLGDLVLALETLVREAEAEEKSLHDHLCHLIVHGFMHCLGFDHVEAEDAEEMEGLETEILADLGISDPYAMTHPAGDDAAERLAS